MRKPSLSPTKITTYLTCKVKFYWAYHTPYGRMRRPDPTVALGANLHRVLDAFHKLGGTQHLSPEQTQNLLERLWSDTLFPDPIISEQQRRVGQNLIQQYYQSQSTQPLEAKVLLTERLLRKDMRDFYLVGRIDRVDEYPDGTLEIIDYKSGRTYLTPEQVENDIALHCYALLLREHFADRPLRIALYALQIGEKVSVPVQPDSLDSFETLIHRLGIQILQEDYSQIAPAPIDACAWCDFLSLCQKRFWQADD